MKSKLKKRASIIIVLGIFCAIWSIHYSNSGLKATYKEKSADYSDYFTLDRENLKISAVSEKIHIDNNWTAAKAAGICTGEGTYSDPYIIEDLEIDGGSSVSCILIENSDVYFRIENCTLYNSGSETWSAYAGIVLDHVNNGALINNSCSKNYYGISLVSYSNNNTIYGNIVNENTQYGIQLNTHCNNNTISGNTANNNEFSGISIVWTSNNNTISGNTVNYNNGDGIHLYLSDNNIVSGNTVKNNRYGIYLGNSNNNTVSGNNASNNNNYGIYLGNSNNNTVSGNTANNNIWDVISLYNSDNNTLSGNTATGIYLRNSNNNTLSGNLLNFRGIRLSGSLVEMASHSIDNTNLVNNKPVYYYANEIGLKSSNFTDAGQIILINCNNSIISGFNLSNGATGIYLAYSDNNTLSENTASNNNHIGIYLYNSSDNTVSGNTASNNAIIGISLSNSDYNDITGNIANSNSWGIYLAYSDYNIVSGNTLIGNDKCIFEVNCTGNKFSDNGDCDYGEVGEIPFELIILISVISGGAVIGVGTLLLIIRKRKRIE